MFVKQYMLSKSSWSQSVHQGSAVGLIEPLRGVGSGSVLSMANIYAPRWSRAFPMANIYAPRWSRDFPMANIYAPR